MINRDELVTGHEKRKLIHDNEGRREGRSTFYTPANQPSKSSPVELESDEQVNFRPPFSSPPKPSRYRNGAEMLVLSGLEVSRASVTSADVQMIEGEQNTSVQGPSLQVSMQTDSACMHSL